MIIIKQNLKNHEETKLQTEQTQVTAITMETKSRKTTIVSAYFPPQFNLKKNVDVAEIRRLFHTLRRLQR